MKKIILIVSILAVACVALYFLYKPVHSESEKQTITTIENVNELPFMALQMRDGTRLQAKDLTGKIVLVLYQPDCDHCQREAQAIQANLDAFASYTLYFITTDSFDAIDTFANTYQLKGFDNVRFGQTQSEYIYNNFGSISAPSVYIYDDGKLLSKFNGETPIEKILKAL